MQERKKSGDTGDQTSKDQHLFLCDPKHQPAGYQRHYQREQAGRRDQHLDQTDIDIRIMGLDISEHRGYAKLQSLDKRDRSDRKIESGFTVLFHA